MKLIQPLKMHGPCTKCINTEERYCMYLSNTPLTFLMLGVLVTESETVKAGNTQKLNYKSTSFFTMDQTHVVPCTQEHPDGGEISSTAVLF